MGSVGTASFVLLLQGVDDDDPLFLQVKEAKPSVLSPYVDLRLSVHKQGHRAWSWASAPPRARATSSSSARAGEENVLASSPTSKGSAASPKATTRAFPTSSDTPDCAAGRWRWPTPRPDDPAMIAGYCGNSRRARRGHRQGSRSPMQEQTEDRPRRARQGATARAHQGGGRAAWSRNHLRPLTFPQQFAHKRGAAPRGVPSGVAIAEEKHSSHRLQLPRADR